MGCLEQCGGVHTAHIETPIQIPIEFITNLLISVSVSVFVSVSDCVNASLGLYNSRTARSNTERLYWRVQGAPEAELHHLFFNFLRLSEKNGENVGLTARGSRAPSRIHHWFHLIQKVV